jgi:hypothetical protein
MAEMQKLGDIIEELKIKPVEQVADELENPTQKPLDCVQQLGALTSLNKAIKNKLDELRETTQAEMVEDYIYKGSDRREVRIAGETIGKVSLRKSKQVYKIVDKEAFLNYLLENMLAYKKYSIFAGYENLIYELLEKASNGEDFGGATFRNYFYMETVPVKNYDKNFKVVGDVVINSETGEMVAGVEPSQGEVTGIMVKIDATPLHIIELAQTQTGDALAGLLSD